MSAVAGVAVAVAVAARSSDSYTLQDLQGGEDGAERRKERRWLVGGDHELCKNIYIYIKKWYEGDMIFL